MSNSKSMWKVAWDKLRVPVTLLTIGISLVGAFYGGTLATAIGEPEQCEIPAPSYKTSLGWASQYRTRVITQKPRVPGLEPEQVQEGASHAYVVEDLQTRCDRKYVATRYSLRTVAQWEGILLFAVQGEPQESVDGSPEEYWTFLYAYNEASEQWVFVSDWLISTTNQAQER
jgi:hypothetical protein